MVNKFARMKQRLNEVASGQQTSRQSNYTNYLFKPQAVTKKYVVRILPLPLDENGLLDSRFDEELNPFVRMDSWVDGNNNLPFKGKKIPKLVKNDPILTQKIGFYNQAKAETNPSVQAKLREHASRMQERSNFYAYVFDKTTPRDTVMVWEMSEKRVEAIFDAIEKHQLEKAKKSFKKTISKQTKVEIDDADLEDIESIIDSAVTLDECIEAYQEILSKFKFPKTFGDASINEVYDIDVFSLESGYDLHLEVIEGEFTNPVTKKVYATKEIKSFTFSMVSTPVENYDELYKNAPHILDDMFLTADVDTLKSILDEFLDKINGRNEISSTKSTPKQKIDFDDADEDEDEDEQPPVSKSKQPYQPKEVVAKPKADFKPRFQPQEADEDEKPVMKRQFLTDEKEDDDEPQPTRQPTRTRPSVKPTPVPSNQEDEDDLPF